MRTTILLGLLLTAAPAAAQTRVYTNADLGQKPVAWTRTVTPAQLESLRAHQFTLPTPLPDGPTVIILSTREEPQPLLPYRPLQPPWSMSAYVGRHGFFGGPTVNVGVSQIVPGQP